MSMYIKNITKNIDIGIRSRTLKPGCGDTFPDEVAEQPGVFAYIKKGWLKSEMVKEVPGAVSVGEIKKAPKKEVRNPEPGSVVPKTEVKSQETTTITSKAEPGVTTPTK